MARSLTLLTLALIAVLGWLLWRSTPPVQAPLDPLAPASTTPDPIATATPPEPGAAATSPVEGERDALDVTHPRTPWTLHGVVRDLDIWRDRQLRVAIAGATIEFRLYLGDELHHMQHTESAPDGSYVLDLAALFDIPPAQRSRGRMEVVAKMPGYRRRIVPVGDRTPAERQQDLWLQGGGFLTGRVVDAQGRPAPGVPVILDAYTAGRFPTIIPVGTKKKTDAAGRFELLIETADLHRLYAFDPSRGIAAVELGHLDLRGRELPDVRLEERSILAGRILLADGTPAPSGVRIVVSAVQGQMRSRHDLVHDAGGLHSLDSAETRTDEQGRFRLAGLVNGLFDVQAFDDLGRQHSGRAATDAPPTDLRIPCVYLIAEVTGAGSDPFAPAVLQVAVKGSSRAGKFRLRAASRKLSNELLLPHGTQLELQVSTNQHTWSETWTAAPGSSRQKLTLRPPNPEDGH